MTTRSRATLVELVLPNLPVEPLLADRSWILSGASSHHDLRGYFFLAPGLQKDASLGVLFEHVPPRDGNQFQLELGVALPDLFPNVGGQPEFSLMVSNDTDARELCFSNVMARLRFAKDGQPLHALIPRGGLPNVRNGKIDFIPTDASLELLRTFATSRYDIKGTSAEEAFETHCESCIRDMVERLNRVLKTMPFVDLTPGRVYSVAYSRATMPSFYFILKGGSEDNLGHGWVAPHVGRSILNPVDLSAEESTALKDYLTGTQPLDDIQSLLHSARSFVDGGVIEYVLLLSVIAAEVATQRFVQKRLLASAVSKGKLEEAEKDLTYSLMLNVVLFAVTPEDRKPDKELVGKMNRGRGLRNAYMHNGDLPKDHGEVLDIFENTIKYVNYLDQVEQSFTPSAASKA
jgi:hypothetical protein